MVKGEARGKETVMGTVNGINLSFSSLGKVA